MARATSGLGQFRGKVGSVVFRVNQGQQIASAYQPAVKNPKSNLQTAQRNKMYLASQLSKLVPREDIVGLMPNGSARDRRSIFIRNIIDSAISTYNGEVFTTNLNAQAMVMSNGTTLEGIGFSGSGENGTFVVEINKSIVNESVYNRLAIKICQFGITNNEYSAYKSSYIELPAYSSVQAPDGLIEIDVNFTKSRDNTIIYAIPILLNDNVRYSRELKTLVQYDSNTQEFAIVGEYAMSNAVLEWKKSQLVLSVGSGQIVPPSTDGDEVVNPDGPNFPNLG